MFKNLSILFLLLLFSNSIQIKAQTHESIPKQIDSFLQQACEHHYFSGSILIAQNDKTIISKGYGQANQEWKVSNETDTKFVIGSISKTITASLVLKLVEEGKFQLSDPILKYLPELSEDKFKSISIHHLLSNTSGIPNFFMIPGWTNGSFRKDIPPNEFIQEVDKLELQFNPGSQYLYSNSGFYLLGTIVERIMNKTYPEIIKEYVFDPLKMKNTGVIDNKKVISNFAEGYTLNENGGYNKQSYFNMNLFKAGGNIFSTTEDLLKWEQALNSNQFLNEKSLSIFFNAKNNYCWNAETIELNESKKMVNLYTYDGQIEGYSSIICRIPKSNTTIIILGNNGFGYQSKKYLLEILINSVYGKDYSNWKMPLSFLITKSIYNNNFETAIELFESKRDNYIVRESRINDLSNQLLWTGNKVMAIKFLKLNAKLFPESSSALFTLAESYKNMNQMKMALPIYQKLLKMHPKNDYLLQILNQ